MIPRSKGSGERVATLSDVALEASVSTATVSRCLNSPHQVDPSTRARVMKAVKDLSYTPNFGARIMAARRTNTVGAVIPTIENSIFARGIQAFQEELNLHSYTLLIASSSYQADVEEEQIRNLIARGAEAMLLIGYDRDPEIYRFLENRRLPVVLTWAFDEESERQSVGFDNRHAMEELTTLVLSHGHRRIGAISADVKTNDRARARVEGIRLAMSKHGLNQNKLHIIETLYSIENGAAAFAALMRMKTPPTVVMCGNDVLAVGALMKAREMGLRVPEDVSITGFDDIELAEVVDPPLTTVHVPHRQMGRQAARVLVYGINNTSEPAREKLRTHIAERASLGPVPA